MWGSTPKRPEKDFNEGNSIPPPSKEEYKLMKEIINDAEKYDNSDSKNTEKILLLGLVDLIDDYIKKLNNMKKSYKEHLKTNRQAKTSFILGLLFLVASIVVTLYFIFSDEPVILGGLIIWLSISYTASILMFLHSNSTNN